MNITSLLKIYRQNGKLTKTEETYLFKKLRDQADVVFKAWVRKRDVGKDCVSSGAQNCNHKIQNACHYISCGRYSHRWDPENVVGGCRNCNGFNKSEHEKFFTLYQIKKHGVDRVDLQLATRHKKKPRIDELLAIIDKYKN